MIGGVRDIIQGNVVGRWEGWAVMGTVLSRVMGKRTTSLGLTVQVCF